MCRLHRFSVRDKCEYSKEQKRTHNLPDRSQHQLSCRITGLFDEAFEDQQLGCHIIDLGANTLLENILQ